MPAVFALLVLLLVTAPVRAATPSFVAHGGPVKDIAVRGARAVSAGFDYGLVVWDLASGRPLRRLMGHRGPVNAVALAAGGTVAVSTGDDGRFAVWDVETGELRHLVPGHAAKAVAVALSADGRRAATAGWDGRVILWRVTDGARLAEFGAPPTRYTGVVLLEDGRLVAADAGGAVSAWRIGDRRLLWRVGETGFPVTRMVRHGPWLFLASIDGTVRVRDVRDGRERFRLEGGRQPILSLAVDSTGRRLATGTATGAVQIWDLAARRPERVLRSAGGQVWALAFSADGTHLFVGSADGALRLFEVTTGRQLAGPRGRWVTETDRIAAATGAPALFGKCRLCHSLTPDSENKSGPTFYGLLGRRVGTLEGYPYSEALRRAQVVWTEETLYRLFAEGPDRYLPGTKMPIQRIEDRQAIRELVAWLARVTAGRRAERQTTEGMRP